MSQVGSDTSPNASLNNDGKNFLVFFMPMDEWHMQEHSGIYSESEIIEIAERMVVESPELANQFFIKEKGFNEACKIFRDSGFIIIDLNKISQRNQCDL